MTVKASVRLHNYYSTTCTCEAEHIVIHKLIALVLLNNRELSSFNVSPVSSLCVLYSLLLFMGV